MIVACFLAFTPAAQALENNPLSATPAQPATSPTGTLRLEDALLAAYYANPTLSATVAQKPVAEAGVVQARIRVNPQYVNEVSPAEATYHFVGVTTTTQLGFKRQRRIDVAEKQIASTNALIRTTGWKIRQDTEAAFFELCIARETLAVMDAYVDVTRRLLLIARQRMEARDASGLEVLRADAAYSDARAQRAPVVVRVQQAQRQLNLVMGKQLSTPLDVAAPPFLVLEKMPAQLPPIEQLAQIAEVSRPEFRQNTADLEVQSAKLRLAKSFRWPDVQTGMGMSSVTQSANTNYWGTHLINKPFWWMTVPITINDYGQGAAALARATHRQLEAQRLALSNQVRQELNTAYSNALAAEQQLEIFVSETLPKQARVVVLSEKGYRNGVIDLTGAITAQQSALNTRLSFLQSASRYFQGLVEVERATGKPLITRLQAGEPIE